MKCDSGILRRGRARAAPFVQAHLGTREMLSLPIFVVLLASSSSVQKGAKSGYTLYNVSCCCKSKLSNKVLVYPILASLEFRFMCAGPLYPLPLASRACCGGKYCPTPRFLPLEGGGLNVAAIVRYLSPPGIILVTTSDVTCGRWIP